MDTPGYSYSTKRRKIVAEDRALIAEVEKEFERASCEKIIKMERKSQYTSDAVSDAVSDACELCGRKFKHFRARNLHDTSSEEADGSTEQNNSDFIHRHGTLTSADNSLPTLASSPGSWRNRTDHAPSMPHSTSTVPTPHQETPEQPHYKTAGQRIDRSELSRLETKVDNLLNKYKELSKGLKDANQKLDIILDILRGQGGGAVGPLPGGRSSAREPAVQLPVTSSTELRQLDEVLQERDQYARYADLLKRCCVEDVKGSVRRILQKLISQEVALQHTFFGGGRKENFNKFSRVVALIRDVINTAFNDTPDKITEKVMVRWFLGAGDRAGGRERRRQAKGGNQAESA